MKTISLIFLFATLGGWNSNYSIDDLNIVTNSEPEFVTKQIPNGQKSRFIICDGVGVLMNSGSQIRYPFSCNSDTIKLHLNGEAFLEISEENDHIITVKTGRVKTIISENSLVSLNINEESNNIIISAGMIDGRVYLEDINQESEMTISSMRQVISTSKETVIKNNYDYESVVGWKDGILSFTNASFDEVKNKLERWYGIEMIVHNNNKKDDFSGSFTNASLDKVLSEIGSELNFKYKIEGNIVIIS